MLGTVNARYQSVQIQLITAEIKVAPDALAVVVLGAFPIAFRTAPGTSPLKPYVDAFALQIEPSFCDVPWLFDAQQPSEQLGISHPVPLRRRPDFLLVAHSNSRRPGN
jgi:hypothetical protein